MIDLFHLHLPAAVLHPFSIEMAASSNPLDHASPRTVLDLDYLYASNTNVSNFVSLKLSGDSNYHLWKAQMLCLMDSHNMRGIVDATFVGPKASSMQIMRQYESLLKGWIFGSVSQDVLGTVVDLCSAKDVWEKLKSFFDPTTSSQQDSAPKEPETKTESKDKDVVLEETKTKGQYIISIQTSCIDTVSTETETKGKNTETERKGKDNTKRNKMLRKATVEGRWEDAEPILRKYKDAAREAISSGGNTVLHMVVGIGHNDFVEKLLQFIEDEEVLEMRNTDGSTALHIAAIVGNTHAADLLVKKNGMLLGISDHKGKEPLHKAYENMHLDTIVYLLKAANDDGKTKQQPFYLGIARDPGVEIGVDLLVNAIFAKQHNLASKLVEQFPEFAAKNDDVLMAIATTFPSGLNYGETLTYPSLDDICERIEKRTCWLFLFLPSFCRDVTKRVDGVFSGLIVTLLVPVMMLFLVYQLICFLMSLVHFSFFMLYFLLWKVATRLVAPIKRVEKKKKEWEEAKKVLELVCDEIDKLEFSGTHHPYYTRPILKAACQNAFEVVYEILLRSPEAIRCTDKNGYDIIQLAVIHRSEKIFNLIYIIGEYKSRYRTIVDSSKNNILHLAGRLAPSRKLKRRTGAALQLQRELQWREEVEKLVLPTYIAQENIFKETPDMVFIKEHERLVKEGEKWMKTTAESCSITAALITTVVFAAAITVPGGSNQDTGIPLFGKEIAFTIFAISDAISLFTASTALLVFLSILTARFSEQDFQVNLPRRLIVGLCTLLLSTIAMMVAFNATLFLVFFYQEPWMLAPVFGLACLPIAFFATLQFPLIVDLLRSTYVPIFGYKSKSHRSRFNLDGIRLLFGK